MIMSGRMGDAFVDSEAAAAAAAQPSTTLSDTAVFGSGHTIHPRIPLALLSRTPEYHSALVDETQWWHRHRDLPAIFRQATYLWTQQQRAAIEQLWPPGWHDSDSRHPLLHSTGTVRPSSAHNASGIHRNRAISVRTAVSDAGIMCEGRSYVLCDLSLTSTHNPTVAEWAAPLAHGPRLLQSHNLLQTVLPRAHQHADHAILQMLIGTYGSFTAVHSDWYGADAYLQLQQGEKLWYLAPPEHESAFRRLFEGTKANKTVNVTAASKAHTDEMLRHGVHAVHQKAGDIIFVPGGWLHAVKNLTDTVAFGSNYLRGWKLPTLIRWAHKEGAASVDSATTPINVAGIFRLLEQALIDPFGVAVDSKPKARAEAMRAAAETSTAARRALAMSDNEIAAVHDAWKKCGALRSSMPRPAPAASAPVAAAAAAAAATAAAPAIRLTSSRQIINATQRIAAEATSSAASESQPAAKRRRRQSPAAD